MRLFFAINLPEKIKAELNKINNRLKTKLPEARWVVKENIHLTIKFLGEVDNNDLENLISQAGEAAKGPEGLHIELNNFDLFPAKSPRIIYITLQSPDLASFAQNFITQIDKLDFVRPERRKFLPHITLARIKSNLAHQDLELIRQTKYQNNFTVKSLDLMSSKLTPRGSIYSIIKSFPL